jgi:cell division protein FtsB
MDFRMKRRLHFPALPRPEEKLRALVDRAPQAEAWAERQMHEFQPLLARFYSARRRIATGAVIVVTALLFFHVMFGANGMVVFRQKRAEYQGLQKEVDSLQRENDRYTEQIKALKSDPKMIEKEAREQLHYARPGEVVYVAPPPAHAQDNPTRSASR